MMKLDLEDFCTGHGGRKVRGYSGLQFEMNCPWCGKAQHLYVAAEKRVKKSGRTTYPGDFVCFKCDVRGRFVKLYAELEGVTWKEALLAMLGIEDPLPPTAERRFKTPEMRETLAESAPEPSARAEEPPEEIAEETAPAPVEPEGPPLLDALPEDFTPVFDGTRWQMPTYLTERGIERATAAKFGLGFCKLGRYAGRIVLPIACPSGRSFTTRSLDPDEKLRYLAGNGAGRLLYGWGVSRPSDTLVICEGPFDVLSWYQAGVTVVGLMGKRLKEEQLPMLLDLRAERYVVALDAGETEDAIRIAENFGARGFVAAPVADYKDANDALVRAGSSRFPKLARAAIRQAVHWDDAKRTHVRAKISGLRARFG
jgi:hypothetical protein